jgi:AmmeMemoRadiSam system protein B
MKLKHISVLFLFLILVLILVTTVLKIIKKPKTSSIPTLPVHEVLFYDENSFIEGISKAEENFKAPKYNIAGAVVNHHLLASFIIADLFKRISVQNPKLLIILGPNHYEKGDFNVLTSNYAWNTKYGTVYPDEAVINNLISKNLARIDEQTLVNDHATSSLLPFIKFYMPSVKVVQLLVSKKLTQEEAKIIAQTLSTYTDKNTVIITSSDFSHYLTSGQANIKDEETLKVINNFNYNTLFSFNSDHLDSPPSLAILLMTMQNINKTQQEIIYHTNSANIRPDFDSFTTSYFSILYH